MDVQYDGDFLRSLKKLDIRVRHAFRKAVLIFSINPEAPELHNHKLRHNWEGYKSINVLDQKNDYRAVYKEVVEGETRIAYFVAIGTHKELFR